MVSLDVGKGEWEVVEVGRTNVRVYTRIHSRPEASGLDFRDTNLLLGRSHIECVERGFRDG